MTILVVDRWMEYRGTVIHRVDTGGRQAYAYLSPRVAITADGAPDAYHPENIGSGHLRHTQWPDGDWQHALVADPRHPRRPLQQTAGRHAGYFVSITALNDPSRSRTDPGAYVDAGRIPYLVLPEPFHALDGSGDLGDFVIAYHPGTRRSSYGVIGDIGGDRALGEISTRMASDLSGLRAEPRSGRGVPPGPTLCLVFPQSRLTPAWPMPPAAIRARCEQLLKNLGGQERLAQLAEALEE
ncbi:MAG: hypothetical protein ACREP7_09090 [Lysobacter sp.]